MSAIPIEAARRRVAHGTFEKNGRLQVACRFDEETFEQIHALAAASNISFASQIRILVRGSLNRLAARLEAG